MIAVVLIGTWFGRHDQQLVRYQATAHQHFVDQFQNGIRGAYSAIESARRALTNRNAALAEQQLTGAYYSLQMMQAGATGMSIRLGPDLIPLQVTARYLNEATMLRDQLLTGSSNQDASQRLDHLSHDLTMLQELLGADNQREWLTSATADQFRARYQSWREKALIKTEAP